MLKKLISVTMAATMLAACSYAYQDEVKAPTEQSLAEARNIKPRGALAEGVFHMQSVDEGSTVRVDQRVRLKRPDLPPFDVAYVNRDIQTVLLELANAAGESIVLPESLRGKTVTVIHAGSDFRGMLDIVLSKIGYHYNYVNGVWYITRYPVRQYQLELTQGLRAGSLASNIESGRQQATEEAEVIGPSGARELNTEYEDELWEQVEETIQELVFVGSHIPRSQIGQQQADRLRDQAEAAADAADTSALITPGGEQVQILTPPSLDGDQPTGGTLPGVIMPETGGLRPNPIQSVAGRTHLSPDDLAEPFYRITRSAGLITARASPEAHRLLESYLNEVQGNLLRQILVEARILAIVRLKDTDRGSSLSRSINTGDAFGSILGNLGFRAQQPLDAGDLRGGFFNLSSSRNDLNLVMQLLSNLGDVYTISSPNLLARNNQISRVAITRQIGYPETTVETNTTDTGQIVVGTRTDEARFKNAGTVFSVLPFIGRNKVQMRMRLSIASQSGSVNIQTAIADDDPVINEVPELSNNLIDQDMVMDYGRVYAVGGVIETSTTMNQSYVPGLVQLPGVADVFRRAQNQKSDTEFMVLMRASRS